MLRKIITFFIAVVIIVVASSYSYAQYFELGLQASPVFGKIKYEGEKSSSRSNISYGLNADIFFTENYAFLTGLWVTGMGGKLNIGDDINGQDMTYKMDYIQIPLALKLKTGPIHNGAIFGILGTTLDFRTGARKSGVEIVNGVAEYYDDTSITKQTTACRMGLLVGGGYEYNLTRGTKAIAGVTYNNGWTNTFKNIDGTVKNSYVALNFGIYF